MSDSFSEHLESWIRAACLTEANAPKAGNVHPSASFDDLCYDDFVASANAVAPILARQDLSVGRRILSAVEETQRVVGKNTNLGIVLLLTPLASVQSNVLLKQGIGDVLANCKTSDSECVFQAIQISQAGGLGKVDDHDVTDQPQLPLVDVMRMAEDRDLIARQYTSQFELVLGDGMRWLQAELDKQNSLCDAVLGLQLQLMAQYPDTLIARKCGITTALESSERAHEVLSLTWHSDMARAQFEEFDQWLRADGHRRNPGTTADIVCAILFAYMRENRVVLES